MTDRPGITAHVEQAYRIADLDDLTEHPLNPRLADLGAIITSIEQLGFYGAVIVQKATGIVCAGNHRVKALRSLGRVDVPIIEVDCDDATALKILLADNRVSDLATNDVDQLATVLRVVATDETYGGLIGTGYEAEDLDVLVAQSNSMLPPLPPDPDRGRAVTCPECGHEFDA